MLFDPTKHSLKKKTDKKLMAYLSTLPTEMTCSAMAGLEAYQEPEAPSLPAAAVTIFPLLLILSATTAEKEADQPLLSPKESVRISMPSLTPSPWRRLSTRTVTKKRMKLIPRKMSEDHYNCRRLFGRRNRTLCMRLVWRHKQRR